MESILTPEDFREIYRLTEKDAPLENDCGDLCGRACCRTGPDQGIYLLPGEHHMFTGRENWLRWNRHDPGKYFFPGSWEGTVFFLHCSGQCERPKRPIQCRTFPAAPHLTGDGRFLLIRETLRTRYRCPILEKNLNLDKTWLSNLYRAWQKLLADPLIYDLVLLDSEERNRIKDKIRTAYEGPNPP